MVISMLVISVGYFTKTLDPVLITLIQFATTSILSLVTAFFVEPTPILNSPSIVLSLFYISLVATLFAFLIQSIAQKYTSSTHTTIILCTESLFGTVFAILSLGEQLTLKITVGCAMIF